MPPLVSRRGLVIRAARSVRALAVDRGIGLSKENDVSWIPSAGFGLCGTSVARHDRDPLSWVSSGGSRTDAVSVESWISERVLRTPADCILWDDWVINLFRIDDLDFQDLMLQELYYYLLQK